MSARRTIAALFAVIGFSMTTHAQTAQRSVAETLVELPALLKCEDGTSVTTATRWRDRRRPELLALFVREMYGQSPPRPGAMTFEVFDEDANALGGKAVRRQVAIRFNGRDDARMDLLIYLPKGSPWPVPVIFGLNFWGNQAVTSDPGVRLTGAYIESSLHSFVDLTGFADHHATDATRGIDAKRWPIEQILAHGYGFATASRGDIDPDIADETPRGVRALYPELQGRPDNFGTTAAWAWAMSRAMDYFETAHDIDAKRVIAFGWSRLGKAALWAAANDERFAAVISSESGAAGATAFHHGVGENIHRLVTRFPHWFCVNFRKYDGGERTMPFDQHMLLALIAPRPLYVATSEGSDVFDPVGEFISAKAAEPAYRLLGATGLAADDVPPLDQPILGRIRYHRRTGKHDVLPFDWEQYLRFCDEQVKPAK